MIYHGIFESVLTYCIVIWGGLSKCDLEDLQVMQNKAIRVVLNRNSQSNRNEMFDMTGCMTVKQLIFYHTVINVYKIKRNQEPEYLYNQLKGENIHRNIVIEKTMLTLTRNGFLFRGAESWNSIPHEIRNISKVGMFKTKLEQWIFENVKRFED